MHRTLGHTYEALKYFNMAISLDPKQATALKVWKTFKEKWKITLHFKFLSYPIYPTLSYLILIQIKLIHLCQVKMNEKFTTAVKKLYVSIHNIRYVMYDYIYWLIDSLFHIFHYSLQSNFSLFYCSFHFNSFYCLYFIILLCRRY